MSARQVSVEDVVTRYATGFFPLYDPWDRFYWERLPLRAVVPVTSDAAARAARMKRRAWKRLAGAGTLAIRYTTAVPDVIEYLMDERVKERSWVRTEVVRIYQALLSAGLLQTIEVWKCADAGGTEPKLVGGLVGIVLPGTFIAETMFGLEPEASKLCVCQLLEDCWNGGNPLFDLIDVQTPHDARGYAMLVDIPEEQLRGKTAHPCVRLGERTIHLRAFLRQFSDAWRRFFNGGALEWIDVARAFQRAARSGNSRVAMNNLSEYEMARAFAMLRHTLPDEFMPVFGQVE